MLSNTLAAIFATQRDAHEAVKELNDAGFKQTWYGKTQPADARTGEALVDEPQSVFRFISLDPHRRSLREALRERGASEEQAAQVEDDIAPGCYVVTVYGEAEPARAASILQWHKGSVIGDSNPPPTAVTTATAPPVSATRTDDTAYAQFEEPSSVELFIERPNYTSTRPRL